MVRYMGIRLEIIGFYWLFLVFRGIFMKGVEDYLIFIVCIVKFLYVEGVDEVILMYVNLKLGVVRVFFFGIWFLVNC